MSSVELGVLNAMSYCWNKHDDSFILTRTAKTIAGAIKAIFSKYTVSLRDAEPVMIRHPKAWFTEPVSRALAEYEISHAQDISRKSATAGSPPSSATAGSPPPLPQPQRVRVNSPFSFSLNETDTTRVRFVGGTPTLPFVNQAYREMRGAAGDSWVAGAGVTCKEISTYPVDHIAFNNKNHNVLSKYLMTIAHEAPTCKTGELAYSMEEVLLVVDRQTGQQKLVRIGSFSENPDGSTTGGGGFPGYSDNSSIKTGYYLQELKAVDKEGNVYQPYKNTKFGIGRSISIDGKIRSSWSCGFDALRMALYQATGYKFSFMAVVAFLEEMISTRDNAHDVRQWLSDGHYPLCDILMEILVCNVDKSSDYPFFLKEERSAGVRNLQKARRNVEGFKICKRKDILETDWDYSSTAILGQPEHSFGVYRNRKSDGTFEYMVYDPHNFGRSRDFYTSPNGQGLLSFATAKEAIDYVTTHKGGHNGRLDAFYRVPDSVMCLLRDRMMATKNRLEENGDGF